MRDFNVPALRKLAVYPIELSIQRYLEWLVPPFSEGIRDEFWETEAGDLLAQAQWLLNIEEVTSVIDAVRLIGRADDGTSIMFVKANLPLYRRPHRAFKYHRPGATSTRAWYIKRSDIDAFVKANKR